MGRQTHQTQSGLQNLQAGEQVVCLYEGEKEKLELLKALLSHSLASRLKTVCLLSEEDQTKLLHSLQNHHPTVEMLVQKGALAFLLAEEMEVARRGARSLEDLRTFVETAARRAVAQGYAGLCFLMVMDSFLAADLSDDLLLAHEMGLRRSPAAPSSLVVACYPRDTKRPQLLFEVLRRPNWLMFREAGSNSIRLLPASVVADASRNSAALAQMVETLTATSGAVEPSQQILSSSNPTREHISPPVSRPSVLPIPASVLDRLNRGHAELARARTGAEISEILLRILTEAVESSAGWTALKSRREGEAFHIEAFRGLPESFVRALDLSAESEGPFGVALRTRRPVVWRSNSRSVGVRDLADFSEVLVFPIQAGERTEGAAALYLPVGSPDGHALSIGLQPLVEHAGTRLAEMAERADLESRLRSRQLPASALVAPAAPPLAAFSADGVLVYANPAFLGIWHATSLAGLPGRSWFELAYDAEQADSVWRVLRGTGTYHGGLKFRTAEGTSHSVLIEMALQYNEVGEPLRVVLTVVPEKPGSEKSVLLEQTRNALLAGVSHELFTPLNAVIGFSEMLLEPSTGPLSDKQTEYLRHVLENGLRLQKLFERILMVADDSDRKAASRPAPIALYPLLKDMVEDFQPTHGGKRAPPLLAVEERAREIAISVEPEPFRTLMKDLLDNADKFTPPSGAILVTARVLSSLEEGDRDPGFPPPYRIPTLRAQHPPLTFPCVEIVVADEGMGLDPEQREAIFEPFGVGRDYRFKGGGLGIGLAFVRKTLARWNGRIWAESEGVGKGCRMVCILPLSKPEANG